MKTWNLRSDDNRAARRRQLFSTPEARVEVIDLARNEQMWGDEPDSDRVVIHVLAGDVEVTAGADTIRGEDGTLVALEPGERSSVRAHEQSRLLLTFTPRPAPRGHSPGSG